MGMTYIEDIVRNVIIGMKMLIAMILHNFPETPTPNEDGTTHSQTCQDCGYVKTEEHNYENGIVDFSDLIRINKFRLHKISEL